jgi:hypothetical protein
MITSRSKAYLVEFNNSTRKEKPTTKIRKLSVSDYDSPNQTEKASAKGKLKSASAPGVMVAIRDFKNEAKVKGQLGNKIDSFLRKEDPTLQETRNIIDQILEKSNSEKDVDEATQGVADTESVEAPLQPELTPGEAIAQGMIDSGNLEIIIAKHEGNGKKFDIKMSANGVVFPNDAITLTTPQLNQLKSKLNLEAPTKDQNYKVPPQTDLSKFEKLRTSLIEHAQKTRTCPPLEIDLGVTPLSQSNAEATLKNLNKVGTISGTGHPTIKAVGFNLGNSFKLNFPDHPVNATHLYVQDAGTEKRLYLGTGDKMFQRVHTSLSIENTAHTMVQTRERLHVPGQDDDFETYRTGYDLGAEVEGKGLTGRELIPRSKGSITSSGNYLVENDASRIQKAEKLAQQFNVTMDKVLAHVSNKFDTIKNNGTRFGSDHSVADEFQQPVAQ